MYCKNCGSQMDDKAVVCVQCGAEKNAGNRYCANCGGETGEYAAVCVHCGVPLKKAAAGKSRLAAGLLGIFLGGLGIHNFYLGFVGKAIAQILLSFCFGIGAIWGFIEGILILTGNIDKDANGVPLSD